ncbi:MAG: hypothetical protein HZA46_02155, partial [Planctomycetales bacterium]|nr:hypothetical protein [Planctomycetales bacterium]
SSVGAGKPHRWLEYVGYRPTGYATCVPWPVVSGTSIPFPLRDEPLEMMLEPTRLQKPYDEAFGPEEMALLHLTNAQADLYAAGARLRNLAPINFSTNAGWQGSQIPSNLRQRFTTLSWDRKNFSPRLRPWEFNADSDGDGKFEFPPVFPGESAFSPLDPRHPFRLELRRLLTVEAGNVNQVHPQMRLSINGVLDVERKPGQPVDRQKGPLEFRALTPHSGGLTSRELSVTWTNLNPPPYPPQPVTVGAINYTSAEVQEWWARYDRQVMARDIYVLLYTFGSGSDATPTLIPNADDPNLPGEVRPLYTPVQLREMAQFAVNLVDALDRDNIITQFEYDKNLGMGVGPDGQFGAAAADDDMNGTLNDASELGFGDDQPGWNLDDNPYTANATEILLDRAVVFGVESQSLTFSEAVALYAKLVDNAGTPVDHFATEWNDTVNTLFAHVELRNASPYPVTFGTNAAVGQQQWAVGYRAVGSTATDERRVIIQNPAAGSNAVAAGGLYSLGSASVANVPNTSGAGNYSQFRVDTTWAVGDPQPTSYPTPISPVSGALNLDLITSYVAGPGPGSPFRVTDGIVPVPNYYDVTGGWLGALPINDGNSILEYEFILYRRAHPTRPAPTVGNAAEENDNPWIAVDRIAIPKWRKFELTPTTDSASAPYTTSDELRGTAGREGMMSMERAEPLAGGAEGVNTPVDVTRNSLGFNNSNTPGTGFSTWQAHFDRDFASAGELLSLPLSSPVRFTADFARSNLPPLAQYTAATPLAASASAKILAPDYPDALDASLAQNNRWYRLFEFVEVPSRTHVGLSPEFNNPLNFIRKPGSINLNTTRHPEVLAGLIDARDVARNYEYDVNGNAIFDLAEDLDGNGVMTLPLLPGLPDATGDTLRNWWNQFIIARDGTDPNGVATAPNGGTAADPTTGRFIPGVAGSHPFRSLSHVGSTGSISGGLESTFLRSLPMDPAAAAGRRHLFELASAGETLSPNLRHRILSKMFNNVTTRSNVFIVYVTVGFFEAENQSSPTGEVRIGGEVAGMARRRGFFIIDRSLAEEAFDSGTGTFSNWRALVKYQLKP